MVPQPFFSKWWCNGAIRNTLFLRILYDITCINTDAASIKNNKAITKKINSCFIITAIKARAEPIARLPTSPIKIFAGLILNIRKPIIANINELVKIIKGFESKIMFVENKLAK